MIPIKKQRFQKEIEAPWKEAFDPPYDARAEWLEPMGARVDLAVFKNDEKVFEERGYVASDLIKPEFLEEIAKRAKAHIKLQK